MKVVFVSGPYNGPTVYDRECNMRRAEALALKIWQLGHVGLCVHSMNRFFFGSFPEEHAYEGDLEIMRRCDAVVFTADWSDSPGARREMAVATELEMPMFFERQFGDLKGWLEA